MSGGNSAKFKITDTKLHVSIVTLSTTDNVHLKKQFNYGFKRSVYWNSCQTISEKLLNQGTNIYELLSVSFQGGRRLLVLTYFIGAAAVNNEAGMKFNRKYFLPTGKINNYNVLIDRRTFLVNQLMI